jgi:hypothetical protein
LATRLYSAWHERGWDEIVKERWPHESASTIARRLGTTRNAVIGRAHRLGLHKQTWQVFGPRNDEARRAAQRERLRQRPRHPDETVVELAGAGLVATDTIVRRKPVSIFELEEHHCRAIVGQVSEGIALYCGNPKVPESSYCARHKRLYYVPLHRRAGGVNPASSPVTGSWR